MPTADGLLSIPGVLRDGSAALEGEAAERRDAAVIAGLGTAIEALKRARLEEGARLADVLADQIDRIEAMVGDGGEPVGRSARGAEGPHTRAGGAAHRRSERTQP